MECDSESESESEKVRMAKRKFKSRLLPLMLISITAFGVEANDELTSRAPLPPTNHIA